ncbi:MAG: PP2C family protein-serine/threonine phosphatase [Lacipirellulaceae bacterium]
MRLYNECEMTGAEVGVVAGRAVAVYSSRSPGKETVNEDSAAVIPWGEDSGVIVVADGLGGASHGQRASRMAVEALRDAIAANDPGEGELRTAILNGIDAANRAVMSIGSGAATTLAVVEFSAGAARAYHVGDAGVIVCGGRGRLKIRTSSHAPVQYGVEAGLLDEDEALHHEDLHLVSNVVGAADSRTEISAAVELADLDSVVVASDGLFDNLAIGELVDLARRGSAAQVATRLHDTVRGRMTTPQEGVPSKCDDLTLVVVRGVARGAVAPAR